MVPRNQGCDEELGGVRVLILINQQVAVVVLNIGSHFLAGGQHPHGQREQIIEVQRAGLSEQILVVLVRLGYLAAMKIRRAGRKGVLINQLILAPADGGQHSPRREIFCRELSPLHRFFYHLGLVIRINDRKISLQPTLLDQA